MEDLRLDTGHIGIYVVQVPEGAGLRCPLVKRKRRSGKQGGKRVLWHRSGQ
jgi:hypothetical protein